MKITVLGCGSSAGVPMIGCHCKVCTSKDPKNRRMRVSILLEINNKTILIDTSPDLHWQAIANGIKRIDAVFYTHDHADHTHGIDELRSFNYLMKDSLPVYGDKETLESLQIRFPYAFKPKPEQVWFRPSLIPHILQKSEKEIIIQNDINIRYFEQRHGKGQSLGYRFGDFAYSTDVDALSEAAFEALCGVKLWVVDCLRPTESHAHSHLARTLEWVGRVKPERAVLTHMTHDFDYDTLKAQLPAGIEPGYDGMIITL